MRLRQWSSAIVAAVVFAGCVGAPPATDAPQASQESTGERSVSFSTWQWSEPGFGDFWKEAVAAYEAANPDVTFDVRAAPGSQYFDQLVVEVSAGNGADIIHMTTSNLPGLQAAGALASLDTLAGSGALDSFPEAVIEPNQFDGELYAYPVGGRNLQLIYNDRLLREAGLSGPPTTTDELLDYARKLTKKSASGTIEQYGMVMAHLEGGDGSNAYEAIMLLSLAFGADMATPEGGALDLTSEGVVSGVTLLKTLYDEELIPIGSVFDDQVALMAQGKVAMLIDGPWNFATFAEADPSAAADFMAAPVPWSPPASTANQHLLTSSAQSSVLDDAQGFMAMLAEPEWQQRYFTAGGLIPFAEGVITPELFADKPYMQPFVDGQPFGRLIPPRGLEAYYGEIEGPVVRAVAGRILQNGEPIEQVLQETEDELNASLTE